MTSAEWRHFAKCLSLLLLLQLVFVKGLAPSTFKRMPFSCRGDPELLIDTKFYGWISLFNTFKSVSINVTTFLQKNWVYNFIFISWKRYFRMKKRWAKVLFSESLKCGDSNGAQWFWFGPCDKLRFAYVCKVYNLEYMRNICRIHRSI